MTCTNPLLKAMATDSSIIDASATYIRIEAIANVFGILSQFALVGLVTLGKDKLVYILTGVKLVLCVVFDLFLVSTLECSANLGVNGIGVSNIIVNAMSSYLYDDNKALDRLEVIKYFKESIRNMTRRNQ